MLFAADDLNFTEQITPYLPVLGTLAGAIVVGIFAIWNRKRGNTETKAPDVNAIWQREERQNRELDSERRLRRRIEDLAGEVWLAFVGYVRRVQSGGPAELTQHEQHLISNGVDFDTTSPTN